MADVFASSPGPNSVGGSSGTAALHLACLAAELGPGDEAITSAITFVASANCALYCGADVQFTDIDSATFNMSSVDLEKKISDRTRAVIPVHMAGLSCDMKRIQEIVEKQSRKSGKKIFVIEDASHAIGASYLEERIGSCQFS